MQHDSPQHVPQEEEPFEIELVVPGSPAAQGTPDEEEQQQEDHDKDKDDEEYSPLSDTEGVKLYRDTEEIESFGAEAPVPAGRLQALLGHLGITSAPKYRIKGIQLLGRVEFKAIMEMFYGPMVISRHTGPAYRASNSDAMADAAWQAITSWSRRHRGKLQNSIHHLLPQRKKDKFKASGVKKDVPRMEMIHHQDVTVELSIRLLAAQ
jgi:hypothetical protein